MANQSDEFPPPPPVPTANDPDAFVLSGNADLPAPPPDILFEQIENLQTKIKFLTKKLHSDVQLEQKKAEKASRSLLKIKTDEAARQVENVKQLDQQIDQLKTKAEENRTRIIKRVHVLKEQNQNIYDSAGSQADGGTNVTFDELVKLFEHEDKRHRDELFQLERLRKQEIESIARKLKIKENKEELCLSEKEALWDHVTELQIERAQLKTALDHCKSRKEIVKKNFARQADRIKQLEHQLNQYKR